jgi:hypothetical protein
MLVSADEVRAEAELLEEDEERMDDWFPTE